MKDSEFYDIPQEKTFSWVFYLLYKSSIIIFMKLMIGVLIAIIFLLILSPSLVAKELRVVLDKDYPPFTYIDKDGNLVGICSEFWKLFTEKTGVKVKLIPVEWEKAYRMMINREADVIDTIFKTPAREEYLDFTKPLFYITSSVYYRSDLKGISSINDLTPYIVGVKEKDALIDISQSINKDIRFRYYKNYSDIVKSAQKGEINVFLMDDIPANYHLVHYGLLYKFNKTKPFTYNYLYLATQKGNTEVLNILNKGLSKFSRRELDSLVEKYTVEAKEFPKWILRIVLYILISIFSVLIILIIFNRVLKRKVIEATKEILEKNQELERNKEEIEAMYEELKASNEELEELYKEVQNTNEILLKTIDTVSKISVLETDEREFLSSILELIISLIPKARYGSVFSIEEDGIRLLVTKGHNRELEGLVFSSKDFIGENSIAIVKDIVSKHQDNTELYNILKEYAKPVSETMIVPLKWNNRIFGYITLDIPWESNEGFTEEDQKMAEYFVKICSAFYAIKSYSKKEMAFLNKIIHVLIKALEYYDIATVGHSAGVTRYTTKIAERLNLGTETARKLYWASYIHDIGKIFIKQDILNKPERLTKEEYELVKLHPIKGEELIADMEELEDIAKIIRYHHERWDGKGYPDGLKGEEIPLESRILAVADAFEAMISERPYKKALSKKEAIEELKRCSGTQFDPKIVEIMISILQEEDY